MSLHETGIFQLLVDRMQGKTWWCQTQTDRPNTRKVS